ncbi:PfkB family carbohydrate kinase [Oceanicella actignis]|uniref:Sugar or nucleoside kinase, ribokinase family n=1 Tax=Oceanicella actignis TaxID=1189325 RepID=A0A1M7U0I7_9RHOB|nr:PfkB family carbohydrate kinase [Oceanicella actignis]SET84315.1 Sugar or nucleoside kinase, ribokinase family [Oceanicella actignis]SHN76453.1 Sugar or nucleoside kinase, ribokinase family [Oceanicella actignis]
MPRPDQPDAPRGALTLCIGAAHWDLIGRPETSAGDAALGPAAGGRPDGAPGAARRPAADAARDALPHARPDAPRALPPAPPAAPDARPDAPDAPPALSGARPEARPEAPLAAPLAPGADLPGRVLRRPGGVALNIAVALAAQGRPAALLAAVGRDAPADELERWLAARAVAAHLARTDAPTGVYLAIEDARGALFAAVADLPGCAALTPEALAAAIAAAPGATGAACWLAEANLPADSLAALARRAARPPLALVAASPAKAARLRAALAQGLRARRTGGAGVWLVSANRAEAEALAGRPLVDAPEAARALRDMGADEALVTDGPRAAAVLTAAGERASLTPPPLGHDRRARLVTGAGDALTAAYVHARLCAEPPDRALARGLAAARALLEETAP